MTGNEPLFGRGLHASVWRIDADGDGKRIGCAPETSSSDTTALAMAPDALYVIVGTPNDSLGFFDFAIVKIAR